MDNYDVVLFANSYGGTVKVRAVQGDTGRTLTCHIADMEIPAGSTANFYALKPSGTYVQKAATLSNGAIIVDLDNQILAEEGEAKAQVEVERSGENVKTFKFIIAVDGSLSGDWPESNNDVTFLDALKAEMEQAAVQAEQAAALANAAALTAQNLLAAYQAAVEGTLINDETPSNLLTYSSQKIEEKVAGVIDDSAASTNKAYSSQKTSSLITAAQAALQGQINDIENDVDSLNSNIENAAITNDILTAAMNVPNNKYAFFTLSGDSYTGSLPDQNYARGSGLVMNRNSTSLVVIIFPESTDKPIINYRFSGAWKGWQDFAGNSITS